MISTSDFKKNSTKILHKNEPWVVVDFSHVKPGKGGAYVRTKLKSLTSGSTYEEMFRSGEKLEVPDLEYKTVQYLYSDELFHFMDQDSYEQISLTQKELGESKKYLKPSENYQIMYFEAKLITIEPPMFLNLKIEQTVPGVRGNTAQGSANKPATLETGLVISVPLFINEGDIVKVDTREDKYIERVAA